MCGLAWRVRRPLPLEIVDMREAKLEGGTVVVSSSSMQYDETPSCGVAGDKVASWRVCCLSLPWIPVQARKGADLPWTVGARRVAVWRKVSRVWLTAKVTTESAPAHVHTYIRM